MTAYNRVLLKLSGEVFGGGRVGVDPDVVSKVAKEIAAVVREGVGVSIVVGERPSAATFRVPGPPAVLALLEALALELDAASSAEGVL